MTGRGTTTIALMGFEAVTLAVISSLHLTASLAAEQSRSTRPWCNKPLLGPARRSRSTSCNGLRRQAPTRRILQPSHWRALLTMSKALDHGSCCAPAS